MNNASRTSIARTASVRPRSVLMASAAAAALLSLTAAPSHAQSAAQPPAVGHDALPQNPNVVRGGAGFATDGARLDVNQSTDRVVIDWRSFDIGRDAEVSFHQPGTDSIAVNRISGGGMPSQIDGVLKANGTVVILNPNGVLFSATSRVDAGGLVASTGRMNIDRFMAGDNRLKFTGATSGAVTTLGTINIADAGLAAFVAPSVRNDGVINARLGRVALAAGETFTLDLAGDRLVEIGLGADTPLVQNYGSILADGGRVQLSAAAAGVVVDQAINAGGLISVASARAEGGDIILEAAGGGVVVSGELDASGATGGGTIHALGDDLTVTGDARLSAAAIRSGDGGFIETSGDQAVHIADGAAIDASGAGGAAGSWLIDPMNVSIVAGPGGLTGSTVAAGAIEDSLSHGTSVTVTTNQDGGDAGDLTVAASVDAISTGGAGLTLTGRHISATGGSTISIDGGALTLNVNAVNPLADTTGAGNWIQDALNVVGAVDATTINLGAGRYAPGATISDANVTLDGHGAALIVLAPGQNGLTLSADDVTVQGMIISGPVDAPQSGLNWSNSAYASNTAIVVDGNATTGPSNFTIADNDISNVRTGVIVRGDSDSGSITGNRVENTKGAILIQYNDGVRYDIRDNSQGPLGNEWGIVLNLNSTAIWNTGTAPTDWQAELLALDHANGGMAVMDRHYAFANRTQVQVDDDSTWTAADDNNLGNGLGNERQPLRTIQDGVDAVVAGGVVNVGAGTYVQPTGSPAYLWINKSVELAGAGQGQTIIDARGASTYGIRVQADDVDLHDFTLLGVTASGGYGIKVEPLQGGIIDSNARIHDFSLSDVTIQGSGKTELDLNGVVGATLTNVTADGAAYSGGAVTAGNGISITDSADITLTGVTTLNNGWGGLALYQTNKTYNQQVDDISVDGSNSFNEANGVYLEDESNGLGGSVVGGVGLDYGDLNIAGYSYVVSDRSNAADIYTWFRRSESDAFNWIGLTGKTTVGYIEGWTGTARDNHFLVGTVAGTTMSINAAVQAARTGALIDIGAGHYAGLISINKGLTLSGAGMDETNLTGGINLANTAVSNLTLQGFTLSGDGGGNAVVRNGRVTNLTVDDVRFDGGNVAGRHGFAGGQFGGDISITNSEFLNIRGWSAFDTSTGGTATAITSVNFSNNLLDGTVGHVTFRQATPTADVLISGNTVRNVGDTTDLSSGIFKVFGANTVDFIGNTVTGIGASPTKLTAGVNDGAALIVNNTATLNITDNVFTGNRQAFLVGAGNALPAVTNITGNTFTNNAYDIYLPASTGGVLNFGAGNAFVSGANTQQHLVWVGAGAVDLTGVTFDGLLGSEMSQAQLFALEDRIFHGVDVAGAGLATVKDGNVFVTASSGAAGLVRGVGFAGVGDTVNVGNGTYGLTSTLNFNTDGVSLVGQSEAGVIVNATGAATYGIRVKGDDVSLSNFTLTGGNGYGVKVEADGPNGADERNTGFRIANVTISGTKKTGLDLNSVVDAGIDGVTVTGVIAGTGIAITDSANVTVSNSTTSGNAWGGVGLNQRNNIGGGGGNQQLTGIVIDDTNSFGETTGVYLQVYASALNDVGDLTIGGFDYVVQNDNLDGGETSYVFFDRSLQDALNRGVNLVNASDSVVGGWNGTASDGDLYVGFGQLTGGGQAALSIQTAFNASGDGDTIHIANGDYGQSAVLDDIRTILFGDVELGGLTFTSNAAGSGLSGSVTASGDIDLAGVVLLGDTRLATTGGDIHLAGANARSAGQVSLDIDGGPGAVELGAIGDQKALEDLTVSGGAITTGGVKTIGDQSYDGSTVGLSGAYATAGGAFSVTGATTLTGATTIASSDGDVGFGTIDGAKALSIAAGGGDVDLGAVGGSAALASLTVSGDAITTAGVKTTGAQSYDGSTVGLSGAYATSGGAFSVTGATTLNGATTIASRDGDVGFGTINGPKALSIDAGAGDVDLGAVGSKTALSGLSVAGADIHAVGVRTTGAQRFEAANIRLAGSYATDGGAYSLIGLTSLEGPVSVATFGGTATVGRVQATSAFDLNVGQGSASLGSIGSTGQVVITGGRVVLTGDVYTGAGLTFLGSTGSTVRLTQALTTFNTSNPSGQGGDIIIQPNLIGTTDGVQSVALIAGSGLSSALDGDITLGNLGSEGLRLGAMTVTGGDLSAQTVKLAGDYTSTLSGDQVFSAHTLDTLGSVNAHVGGNESGPIIAGGSVTIVSGGTANGSLTAGGPVNITSTGDSNRVINSGGPVTLVSGGDIGGSIVSGGDVNLTAQGAVITSVTTPDGVTINAGQPIDVEIDAGSVAVNAPGGTIDGIFDQIITGDGGTYAINGETVIGSGGVDARQFLINQFLAPVGGVVGSTGQIQLPVSLAVALIAPAGEGEGGRRPIVVNSIERLGELLRLGYTAIIVQLDDEEPFEQELDIAAETDVQPVG